MANAKAEQPAPKSPTTGTDGILSKMMITGGPVRAQKDIRPSRRETNTRKV